MKAMNKKVMSRTVLCVAVACALSACAGLQFGSLSEAERDEMQTLTAQMTPDLRGHFTRLYEEGERNAVLNFEGLALKALETGQYEVAERALDEAIRRIETIYADNASARKAKSTWTEERVKDFKGEPYERAMAFYYRGVLYLRRGDYQNARASFLRAEYQDTVSEREEFQGDFAVMTYLAGWSSICDGDETRGYDLVRAALSKAPQLAAIPANARFLGILDTGVGPTKVGAGKHKEILQFGELPGSTDSVVRLLPSAMVVASSQGAGGNAITGGDPAGLVAANFTSFVPAADVQYQATTRGGRPIQGILDGKAQFKDNASAVGDAAMAAGEVAAMAGISSNNSDLAGIGVGMALFGALAKAASEAAKPEADTRFWAGLPREIHLVGGSVPPPDGADLKAEVDIEGVRRSLPMAHWGGKGRCAIAWGKTRAAPDPAQTRKAETSSKPSDKAFRAALAALVRIEN